MPSPTPSRVAVVGAGPGGLTAALRLAQAGQAVQVFEAAEGVGGLARGFHLNGEALERYYHHVFTHDHHVVDQAESLGLGGALRWLKGSTAVWAGGRLRPFNGALDLLRYDALPFHERLRLGLATLAIRHAPPPADLDDRAAMPWLRGWYGAVGTEAIWAPLLRKKFEGHTEAISAAWMRGKIALRGGSRKAGQGEALGYLDGSFQRLHEAMAEAVVRVGGQLHLNSPLQGLRRDEGGAWWLALPSGEVGPFEQVLLAIPPRRIAKLTEGLAPEAQRFAALKAQGVVVALLSLKQALGPAYWTNVNDGELPMGAIIEHTRLVPPERYGGAHVVYLPRYTAADGAYYAQSDQAVLDGHFAALRGMFPNFHPDQVQGAWVFRDAYTQPVTPVGYAQQKPPLASEAPGLFYATMHHIYPEDRGMNYAMAVGEQVAQAMLKAPARQGAGA